MNNCIVNANKRGKGPTTVINFQCTKPMTDEIKPTKRDEDAATEIAAALTKAMEAGVAKDFEILSLQKSLDAANKDAEILAQAIKAHHHKMMDDALAAHEARVGGE